MDKSKKKYTKKVVDKFYPSFCRIQVYRNQKKANIKNFSKGNYHGYRLQRI